MSICRILVIKNCLNSIFEQLKWQKNVCTAKEKFDIPEETIVYIVDGSGTEVDEDGFSDVLDDKSDIVWTLTNASSVESNSNTIKLGLSCSLFHSKNTNAN